MSNRTLSNRFLVILAIVVAIGATVFISALNLRGSVPTNMTGIRTIWGVVQEEVVSEGPYLKVPFSENLIIMDNRIQSIKVVAGKNNPTTTETAETADQQELPEFDFTIQYRLLPEKSITVYKTYGADYAKALIQDPALPMIKNVFAQFNADTIVDNKETIPKLVQEKLAARALPYGVEVVEVIMSSYNFTPELNEIFNERAMEAAKLENNRLKQENEKLSAQTNYEVMVKAAERDAEIKRINDTNAKAIQLENSKTDAEIRLNAAKADNEARILSAEATRIELEAQAAGINEFIIQQEWIEKWDGKLVPNFGGTSGSSLNVMDFTDVMKDALTKPTEVTAE